MRVLLLAEACNPEWTSVPLVGWSWARALAERVDLELVTHVRNRRALERAAPPFAVHFVDNEWIAAPLYRLGRWVRGGGGAGYTTSMALSYLPYLDFERRAYRRHRDALRRGRFDLVHRITPTSPAIPSPIARRCRDLRIPFVVGPLNGGLPWPPGFPGLRQREKEWLVPVRDAYRWLPFHRSTFAGGTLPVAGSLHTRREIERTAPRCAYLPENGVDPATFHARGRRPASPEVFRIVWIGRMVPYKMPDLVVRAAAQLPAGIHAELEMIGDGPLRRELEELARSCGIGDRVEFPGWLPREAVADRLRQADVFCFPSVREFGGGVVVEAMACGTPAIVAAHGGPSELVDERSGVVVSFQDRVSLERGVADALQRLSRSPELREGLGRSAIAQAARFTWSAKAEQMLDLYRAALDSSHSQLEQAAPRDQGPLEASVQREPQDALRGRLA